MADEDVLRSENHSPSSPTEPPDPKEPSHEVDWTLVVRSQSVDGQKTLRYSLSTRERQLEDFGSVTLELDLQSFFTGFFRDLDGLRRLGRAGREDVVESMGHELANQLLPGALQQRLHALRATLPRPARAQILSDEYAIPWEMLRIEEHGDGFYLGEEFALGRWRSGGQIHLWLPLRRPALVGIRTRDLDAVEEEIAALETLFEGHGREVRHVRPTFEKITAAMALGIFDGWHFMGHGNASKNDPDQWAIPLEDSTSLTPRRLYGKAKSLGDRHAPLVFMNSCYSGKGGQSLTRIGGWADRFLDLGAGAFVGASWQIDDGVAKDFARVFYQAFLGGLTIGEAARQARLAVRQRYPGDPSWLAYAVFAHPGAICAEKATAVEDSDPRRPPVSTPSITLDDPPRRRAGPSLRSGSRAEARPGSRAGLVGAALAVLVLATIVIVFALGRNGSEEGPPAIADGSGQTDVETTPPPEEETPPDVTRGGSPPPPSPPPAPPPPPAIPLEPIEKGKVGVAVIDRDTLEWSGDVARIVLRKLRDQLAGRSDLKLAPIPQALRPRLGEIFEESYATLPGGGRSPYGLEYIFLMAESHGPHAANRTSFPTVSISCEMSLISAAGPKILWSSQLSHLGQKRTEPEALDFAVGNCIEESSVVELF